MPARRVLLAFAALTPVLLSGCGWTPLYAEAEAGPADIELHAIRVDPISERIGQRLEIALRNSLNPTGEPTPTRYVLRTGLAVSRAALGIQAQGVATRGKVDVIATYALIDLASGATLLKNTTHAADAFDIVPNEYATVVAEDDARTRTVENISREIVTRLTLFMQRRAATGAKPS